MATDPPSDRRDGPADGVETLADRTGGAYSEEYLEAHPPRSLDCGARIEDRLEGGPARAAQIRGRWLARTTDLTDEQAQAVAWRELGYATTAIARELGKAPVTIDGWLDRTAAQYGLRAIENTLPHERGPLEPMTPDRLLDKPPAIRLQYREVAVSYPSVVPAPVMEMVAELNEHGTRPSSINE